MMVRLKMDCSAPVTKWAFTRRLIHSDFISDVAAEELFGSSDQMNVLDWLFFGAFAGINAWSLWSARKYGRIAWAHIFTKQLWAERTTQPRLFWALVIAHVICLVAIMPTMIVGRL
ncbi:hypothetical protein H7F51_00625 [Novosphingobium flavum]|uniref:Uncharacterized protein n=1 Tax=Novosphingobium flavum TaxID=1778672 RepID=A0A7X1FNL8_9SPHN|nr:hypothetical protein [Novosphingobium flavum]MBC2664013.1 hypothetical protein [Novosphingobium flavum]